MLQGNGRAQTTIKKNNKNMLNTGNQYFIWKSIYWNRINVESQKKTVWIVENATVLT